MLELKLIKIPSVIYFSFSTLSVLVLKMFFPSFSGGITTALSSLLVLVSMSANAAILLVDDVHLCANLPPLNVLKHKTNVSVLSKCMLI